MNALTFASTVAAVASTAAGFSSFEDMQYHAAKVSGARELAKLTRDDARAVLYEDGGDSDRYGAARHAAKDASNDLLILEEKIRTKRGQMFQWFGAAALSAMIAVASMRD